MSQDVVLIDRVSLAADPQGLELSAFVDGERVWFRFPTDAPIQASPAPFIALGLQEAMVRGATLRVAAPAAVPSRLLAGLEAVQDVFLCWNDEDFHRVTVEAAVDDHAAGSGITLSAYSGGIDSSYTYVKERQHITHLLLVQGFDGNFGEDIWRQNVAARACFAAAEGKVLLPVATNARHFIEERRLSWNVFHGSLLAALGVALGAERMLVPSSFTVDQLLPWGSHPLLEPLWSTEVTQVVHHGVDATRTAKTTTIAQYPPSLAQLQVCWRGVDKNCGACPKCVRTSLALHLLGASAPTLPPYESPAQLRWLKPSNLASLAFTEDLIHFAVKHQRPDIAKPLQAYRRHFLARHHAVELVKVYGAKWARALARRWARKDWHGDRAKLQSTRSWLD